MNILIKDPADSVLSMLDVMDVSYTEAPDIVPDSRPYFHTDSFRELLSRLGMSQIKFSEENQIPYRSVNSWCAPPDSPAHRDCPQYLIDFIIRAYDLREN